MEQAHVDNEPAIHTSKRNIADTLREIRLKINILSKYYGYLFWLKYRSMRIILADTHYILSVKEESETSGDAAGKRELRNSCLGGGQKPKACHFTVWQVGS